MKKEAHADSRRKGDADFLINVLGLAPIDQRGFSVEIRVKKEAHADSRRKGSADFLIRGMGPAPINQRFFSV